MFKEQYAFYDNDPGRHDPNGLLGAVVDHKVIDRSLDRNAFPEVLDLLDQEVGLEGIRVIVVQCSPFLIVEIVMTAIIKIMA